MHGNVIGPAANRSTHQSRESKQGAACYESEGRGSLPCTVKVAELHFLRDLTGFVKKAIKPNSPQDFCIPFSSQLKHNCLFKWFTFNFINTEINSVEYLHSFFEHHTVTRTVRSAPRQEAMICPSFRKWVIKGLNLNREM